MCPVFICSKSGALLSAQAVLQARDSDKRVDNFLSPTFLPAYQTCCVNSDLCHLFYEEYADYTCDKYTLPLSSMCSHLIHIVVLVLVHR